VASSAENHARTSAGDKSRNAILPNFGSINCDHSALYSIRVRGPILQEFGVDDRPEIYEAHTFVSA
jgi:hypothetical protein